MLGSADDPVAALLLEREHVTEEQLAQALQFQHETGGELGWILASMGVVSRKSLYEAEAEIRGLPMAGDIDRLRTHLDVDLLTHVTYSEIIEHQALPFAKSEGTLVIVTAAPGRASTLEFMKQRFDVESIAEILVTDLDLTAIVSRNFRDNLVDGAVVSNFERNPEQSASRVFTTSQLMILGGILLGSVVWLYLDVRSFLTGLVGMLQIFFLVSVSFKVLLSVAGAHNEIQKPVLADEIAALKDHELPVYTVLVPVYKEAEVVGHLVEGLKSIDYPQHKLDVILLLEEDDLTTLQAAKDARAPAYWRFLVVPNRLPRTKPKACNYGLFFARGEYLVIYDAEDVPEPTQLKAALCAFRKSPPNYVCFQAALNYFNAEENFLTRMFTLEYSYWFDYLIPGLDRLNLPIPLGGTSNHFDVAKLRKLGGWDPFNTTEDADLGIRAAAEKYRVGFINSTTYEEANASLGNWLRQRSRWVKGYMQTWLVYSRHPVAMIKAVGLKDFIAFQLFVGGTPLAFLAAPPLWILFFVWLITRTHLIEPIFPDAILYAALTNLLIGNFFGIYLNMIAVFYRKNFSLLPFALLNPIYWLLASAAAYKALWQLFTKPFYWEKTNHGITRVTRTSTDA